MKELLNHSGEVASEAWLQAQLQAGKSGMAGWAACVLADIVKDHCRAATSDARPSAARYLMSVLLEAGSFKAWRADFAATMAASTAPRLAEAAWAHVVAHVERWEAAVEAERTAALAGCTAAGRAHATSVATQRALTLATAKWENLDRHRREHGGKRRRPARESGEEETRRQQRTGCSHHGRSGAVPAALESGAQLALQVVGDSVGVRGVVKKERRRAPAPLRTDDLMSVGGSVRSWRSQGVAITTTAAASGSAVPTPLSEGRRWTVRDDAVVSLDEAVPAGCDGAWRRAFAAARAPSWARCNEVTRAGELMQESTGTQPCRTCGEDQAAAKCPACRQFDMCGACLRRDGCQRCQSFDDEEEFEEFWTTTRQEEQRQRAAEWGWETEMEGWSCACGGEALMACVQCGELTCGTEGCTAHAEAYGCGELLPEGLRATVRIYLDAARTVTGCRVAMGGVWMGSELRHRVAGAETIVPFAPLRVWAAAPERPRSWTEALSRKWKNQHRHVESKETQCRNAQMRAQAGMGTGGPGEERQAVLAVDHEALKATARSMGLAPTARATPLQRHALHAAGVRAGRPLHTFRQGHSHAIFVVGRGGPLHAAYLSTEERATLDEMPRLELLRAVYTPLQVQMAAGLGGHAAVWRAVARRTLELCSSTTAGWRDRRAGGGQPPVRMASMGTGAVDGATDALGEALRGLCPVRVVCAAERDPHMRKGWVRCYGSAAAAQLDGGQVSVDLVRAMRRDARSASATRDAPDSDWVAVSLSCPPMSPATRIAQGMRRAAIYQLCGDLWDTLYQRIAGRPLERCPTVLEVEMVEGQLWQLGGLAGQIWGGVLLSLPYVFFVQEIDPHLDLHRSQIRGRVFHVGVRRDVAAREVARFGGDWRAWEAWQRRGREEAALIARMALEASGAAEAEFDAEGTEAEAEDDE